MNGLIIALFPKNECDLNGRSAVAYGFAIVMAAAGVWVDADELFKCAVWNSFDALSSLVGRFVRVRTIATRMAAR
jgi:hypothetical protein